MKFLLTLLSNLALCGADLRMASQPKNEFKARDRGPVKFVPDYALYMEPSDFGYEGLKNQRDGGGYDNFLRSNIDNEQDRRDFKEEDGKDHLPFRSYETASTDAHESQKNKIPDGAPGPAITATPGEPYIVPLRWNNPHSSELEVNIWIEENKYVVPIRKPACSGEGHQDNVFTFTVPNDFNSLGAMVPNFKGCKQVGDCVLQIYAHSVESRTYAIGTPLIVEGTVRPATATTTAGIEAAKLDVGLSLDELPLKICLPSNDPAVNIANAVPRQARLVSDVFNHAYQNSDFSPYSGQQPEAISRNMQASAILKMVVGNRGELGKHALKKDNRAAANFAKKVDKKARNLIRTYESITNQIIEAIGYNMENNDTSMTEGQKTATCFRCAEVGSTTTKRQTTNTYVPSFQIPAGQLAEARMYVAPIYQQSGFIDDDGLLQIYSTVLNDMGEEFVQAGKLGLYYMPAMLKDTLATKADVTNFKKYNAAGEYDHGYYAATEANKIIKGEQLLTFQVTELQRLISNEDATFITAEGDDMDGLNYDSNCDDDSTFVEGQPCVIPGQNAIFPGQMFTNIEDDTQVGSAATVGATWLAAASVLLGLLL